MSWWFKWFPPERVRTALIVLSSAAAALAILTYFVVFFPTGSYQPVVQTGPTTTFSNISSSTIQTSTLVNTTGTPSDQFVPGGTSPNTFVSDFAYPYPVTWNEGHEQFSVTAASVTQNALTLTVAIQMGNVSECVPLDVRLISDESGSQRTPDAPAGSTFIFPDTQTCNGTPGSIYSQSFGFTIDSVSAPFLLTTGGTSNQFFQVATSSNGSVNVTLPSTSG